MSLDLACKDTICALSSAAGPAALAIVRASGPQALSILQTIFKRSNGCEIKPFIASRGQLSDTKGQLIDDVIAIYYPKGRSFTGEESFELNCHGNAVIIGQVLRVLCEHGARLAEPGEFSLRALLNGTIDLAQAESIADLIHAESEEAKAVALKGVLGGLSERCAPMRDSIVQVLAEIEARMDFPDEDLGTVDRSHLVARLSQSINALDALLEHASLALKLHQGVRLVICGAPNAGKSTLLNRLCGEERAIVHESAGTTRDVIEARMSLQGIPVVVIDVAGIRAMRDAGSIEQIGIEKAFAELTKADAIIWLADCTVAQPFNDALIEEKLQSLTAPIIKVLNKAELKAGELKDSTLMISAALNLGIADLKGRLAELLVGAEVKKPELFITRARQRDELMLARAALDEARTALCMHMVDEVITAELRAAGLAFDRLFGTMLAEDVLDRIFSQFCIGK